MIHVFRQPDRSQGGDPREIRWDPDAPSVTGDHYQVDYLRDALDAAASKGRLRHYSYWCPTPDPWRDPAQFMRVLQRVLLNRYDPAGVPAALRGVPLARLIPVPRPNGEVQ